MWGSSFWEGRQEEWHRKERTLISAVHSWDWILDLLGEASAQLQRRDQTLRGRREELLMALSLTVWVVPRLS